MRPTFFTSTLGTELVGDPGRGPLLLPPHRLDPHHGRGRGGGGLAVRGRGTVFEADLPVPAVTRHLDELGQNRRRFIDPNGESNREPRKIHARWPGHMVQR